MVDTKTKEKKKGRRGICEYKSTVKKIEEGVKTFTKLWDISFAIIKVREGDIYQFIFTLIIFYLFIIIFISIFTLSEVSLTSF